MEGSLEATVGFSRKSTRFLLLLAGLVGDPRLVRFWLLPELGGNDRHGTREFRLLERKVAYARGVLIQEYRDPSQRRLNKALCDAALGRAREAFRAVGFSLLEVRETRCVKRGDSRCEYEFTWLERPGILKGLILLVLAASVVGTLLRCGAGWSVSLGEAVLIVGAVYGIFCRFRQRQALQEAFEYQQETLADLRCASISKEILNRRLVEYQKQMNECISLASIGEMSFQFAHDLGGPLTLLTLYTEEMRGAIRESFPNEDRLLAYCRAIEEATQRLIRFQRLFRAVAKGNGSDYIVQVDLAKVVQDLVDLYRPHFEKNRITVELGLPLSGAVLSAYDGTIESILLNLFQNATQAIGGLHMRWLSVMLSDLGDRVALEVRDTAPARRSGGTGLQYARQMIHRLGGELGVKSGSTGTCFSLVFRKEIASYQGEVS